MSKYKEYKFNEGHPIANYCGSEEKIIGWQMRNPSTGSQGL